MRYRTLLRLVPLLALVAGCYDDDPTRSSDIATADMDLHVEATVTDADTDVTLSLLGPTGEFSIDGGDTVRLLADGVDLQPTASDGDLAFHVPASLDQLALRIDRPSPQTSAQLDVVLPAAPTPVLPAMYVRSSPMLVTWQPDSTEGMSLTFSVTGPCIEGFSVALAFDQGRRVVFPSEMPASTESCEATVTLERYRLVNYETESFALASATLRRSASATVASVP